MKIDKIVVRLDDRHQEIELSENLQQRTISVTDTMKEGFNGELDITGKSVCLVISRTEGALLATCLNDELGEISYLSLRTGKATSYLGGMTDVNIPMIGDQFSIPDNDVEAIHTDDDHKLYRFSDGYSIYERDLIGSLLYVPIYGQDYIVGVGSYNLDFHVDYFFAKEKRALRYDDSIYGSGVETLWPDLPSDACGNVTHVHMSAMASESKGIVIL